MDGDLYIVKNPQGRPYKYEEVDELRVVGFILHQNLDNKIVQAKSISDKFLEITGKQPSDSFVRDFIKRMHFSRKLCGSAKSGYCIDMSDLSKLYGDFLTKVWTHMPSRTPHRMKCSFDFTFTSHRKDKVYTITPIGR